VTVIPFYGADDPAMFAIERAAMDRDGLVVRALDELLPPGRVLDVGAGGRGVEGAAREVPFRVGVFTRPSLGA
jgi:hypothetical protein